MLTIGNGFNFASNNTNFRSNQTRQNTTARNNLTFGINSEKAKKEIGELGKEELENNIRKTDQKIIDSAREKMEKTSLVRSSQQADQKNQKEIAERVNEKVRKS